MVPYRNVGHLFLGSSILSHVRFGEKGRAQWDWKPILSSSNVPSKPLPCCINLFSSYYQSRIAETL